MSAKIFVSLPPQKQVEEIDIAGCSNYGDIVAKLAGITGAGHGAVLKLYRQDGCMVPISPRIAPNTADSPYRLEIKHRNIL